MIVLSIVFGRLAHLASDDMPYPAFCLAGLLPWSLFASGVTQAANSLVGNVNLLTKVYFLRLLLPLSHVISALIDFAVSFVLLVVVLMCYGIVPGWQLSWSLCPCCWFWSRRSAPVYGWRRLGCSIATFGTQCLCWFNCGCMAPRSSTR